MDSIAIATMGKFTGPSRMGIFAPPPPPQPGKEDHQFPQIEVKSVRSTYVQEEKIEVKSVSEDD